MGNPIWADPNYLKLWIYCLFQASYKEHEQLVGNQMVKLERGQFITGRFALAEEMNRGVKPKQRINELTWWRHLSNLEKFGMLNIKTTNKYSIVTVENYDFYQGMVSKDEQQSEQQLNNKRTTDEQQLNTNNKDNKKNKDNNTSLVVKFSISDMENAKLLFELMQMNNPDAKKPNFDKWADEFRLIRERDNRTDEQIKYLIRWTQHDAFWKSNILSPSKLRKQWDQLALKAKEEHARKQQMQIGTGPTKGVNWEALAGE